MEYQKSMMKIMEKLLYDRDKENSIESIIRGVSAGRNSSFNALKWLDKNGFVKIRKFGNQKIVKLAVDNYSLQYKYYFDSIEFKSLDPFIKLAVRLFVSELFNKHQVKMAILFGSVLKKGKYNDIDLLLLGRGLDSNSLKSFLKIREKIERVLGIIINIHFDELNVKNIFKGIVVYQSSYINVIEQTQKKYLEFLESALESIKNKRDGEIFKKFFSDAILNLSYVYCFINLYNPRTKKDALEFFEKKYKVSNLDALKKRGIEIGKEIFG